MTAIGGTELRPLSIGEILDAALKVYRNNFKTLTLAVLAVVLPLTVLDTLIQSSTNENAFDFTATATDTDGGFIAGQLVSGVLSLLMYSVAVAACFYGIMRGYLGESTTWQESVKFGLKRMLPIIGLGILFFLGVFAGFLLLLIPGIWLAVRWSVSAPALIAEDVGPTTALGRSFNLVKGRWWPTFGALLAMTILVSILQFLVGLLLGAIFVNTNSELLVAIVFTLVTALAYALTLPIQSAVFTILYYDLRVRKEGYDLQLAAGGMGVAAPLAPGTESSSGGGFTPPASDGGFSPPSSSESGGFAPAPEQPAAASSSGMDTSGSVPPPGFGGGGSSGGLAIPTPAPAAAAVPEPEPASSGFGEPTAPATPEPEPSSGGYGSTATPEPEPEPEPTSGGYGSTATPEPEPEPEPTSGGYGNTATPEPEPEPATSAFGNTISAEDPAPAPGGFGEPVAPAEPEPSPEPTGAGFSAPAEPATAPEPAEEPGFSWSPTPPDADEDDSAPPPPGGSPPAPR